MASNNFANVAAATSAGWTVERFVRTSGENVTRLKLNIAGLPGESGQEIECAGQGASSGAADTVALANCNQWRAQRYGSDSAGVNLSPIPEPGLALGSSPRTHTALTKDKH